MMMMMRHVTQAMDRSGTRGVDASEVRRGLHSLGVEVDAAAAARLVARFDRTGDGQVSKKRRWKRNGRGTVGVV